MALEEYRRKRDFGRTREPRGKLRARRGAPKYLIQMHAASRLHYDFRLEWSGVLLSWAVPKGPSLDPRDKRLAVHVEDHPLEYGTFEGTIPKGEYGGGTVMLWDRGTWEPEGDVDAMLRSGSLKFTLHGEKLRGSWALVRMRARKPDDGDKNWLLIKHQDDEARRSDEYDVTSELPLSVSTGRDLDEIAAGRARKKRASKRGSGGAPKARTSSTGRASKRAPTRRKTRARVGAKLGAEKRTRSPTPRVKTRTRSKVEPGEIEGARRAALPRTVEPELATLVSAAPSGPGWVHEVKFDGYRTLCRIDGRRIRWLTRRGKDWTERFDALSAGARALGLQNAILDGEIVVLRPDGVSSFQDLQQALSDGRGAALTYYAFDLLHLDGFDLRSAPLLARKRALDALVSASALPDSFRFSAHVDADGARFHEQACAHGLEGIICKRADEPYRSGRQRDWLKVKCGLRQEFAICGFTDPEGARTGVGALVLCARDASGTLAYKGRVGTGFSEAVLRDLRARLGKLETKSQPFEVPVRGAYARGVHWVRPKLVAEVAFTGWTADGLARHPSFLGLREDKRASEVVDEVLALAPRSRTRKSKSAEVEVAGVRITHPERVVYPEREITKLAVARYYESVAELILPHVVNRPLAVVRCPGGWQGECFFQKHGGETFPAEVKSVRVRDAGKEASTLMIDSLAGLIALVQMGVLELHPWGSRRDKLEFPDRMIFDLDPSPEVAWKRVELAARFLHEFLGELGLESFVKTTGGKGLHVVVPLSRRNDWDEVKSFSKAVAEHMVRASPGEYIATASKARRKGKIFIDTLRNARGSTAVAAYSTRARAGAPVSMPIAWRQLTPSLHPGDFDLESSKRHLARREDPWAEFDGTRQSLTAAIRRKVGG